MVAEWLRHLISTHMAQVRVLVRSYGRVFSLLVLFVRIKSWMGSLTYVKLPVRYQPERTIQYMGGASVCDACLRSWISWHVRLVLRVVKEYMSKCLKKKWIPNKYASDII